MFLLRRVVAALAERVLALDARVGFVAEYTAAFAAVPID